VRPARALVRPEILCAWKGPSLLVVNTGGVCGADQALSGYYFREARHLRTCRFEINGSPPWLCEAAAVAPDTLHFTYSHPEVTQYGGGGSGQSGDDAPRDDRGLPQRALAIQVTYQLGFAGLDVIVTTQNCSREALEFELACALDADFADIQEAQAERRQQQAPVAVEVGGASVIFRYSHGDLPYSTTVRLPPSCVFSRDGGRAAARLRLSPSEAVTLRFDIRASDGSPAWTDDDIARREKRHASWRRGCTQTIAPGNRLFEEVLASNVRDFASFPLFEGAEDEWLTLQAGVPLYPAFFGRDAVTAGWQAGYVDCGESLDAALTRLGRLQSRRTDDWHDEEPGRIPYQVRIGPLARLGVNPYAAYYADFASPLMFVIALANLHTWGGSDSVLDRHWDTARRILDWARERGDADGDGYLEYRTRSPVGTKNQGWKDSGDAIVYDDGTPVPAPTATCELQGYWYAAQQLMAVLSWMRGDTADARAWLASAADLKRRFNRDWWLEDRRFFALAMDPDKRLVGAVTSNVGHCVASGIIDADHLPPVVGRLFSPDMFSGWGIRTLSSSHAFYDPLSYHRGSVWPVEQATILFGLRRFGFDARAHDLATGLFELAQLYPDYRIPECVGGYGRGERPTPGAYPRANTPQLWNATAFPLMVQTLLGLLPLAPYELLIVDPALPEWLPDITLRNLRVGGATITLRCWREDDGTCDFEVLDKRGTLRVVRQPPPESLSATLWDRVTALT
jgi:glycogen debranching enzyme